MKTRFQVEDKVSWYDPATKGFKEAVVLESDPDGRGYRLLDKDAIGRAADAVEVPSVFVTEPAIENGGLPSVTSIRDPYTQVRIDFRDRRRSSRRGRCRSTSRSTS